MDLPSQPEQTYFSDIPNSIAFSIADEKDEMASERFKTVINLAPERMFASAFARVIIRF